MTTTPSNEQSLEGLIERVNAATGPDRELSRDLLTDVGGWAYEKRGRDAKPWMYGPHGYRKDPPGVGVFGAPHVTKSVDDALALVERLFGQERPSMLYSYDLNWHASAHAHMSYTADLHIAVGSPPVMQQFHGQAHTQPLAILSALLLSLQSEADK